MTRLILVPAAQTDWRAQGRLAGDTDLPLNEHGHRQAVAYGEAIAALRPTAIHCGPEAPSKQTATIIAHELGLKAKTAAALREMDLGHWEGIRQEDLRERYAKAYRQWRSAPASVEPPEGEGVQAAAERLVACVEKIIKRRRDQTLVLTLGQFAFAIVRCRMDDGDYEQFWNYVDGTADPHVVNTSPAPKSGQLGSHRSAASKQ